ncbi:MerR family transcriptional regulator [Clostridium folliculivorans]|uniref:MerR family transcriptional regulator n=1 Tax=Clostridium folliculivorans TaxID=2886038 RepID=A0A9W5Y1V8_9CLOT|nr:MerR family transcriptional regulator [Clostridium folliculivorans]GKU25093.1 MerR family transcriptional regulator [Clostridium folliculivorans]GKU31191.1 MerR family transcriptional regulator [Clostridium folliculivorans]
MLYTVKEVAKLTGVTIKALHHYHKIGLLQPCEITDAGYRLYGTKELEILQQILFYRELDFSLENIKKALEDEPSRLICLTKQQELLLARKQRLDCLLKTINESIVLSKEGEIMNTTDMFKGFNKDQWKVALSEQSEYIKDKYGYDIPEVQEADVPKMNEQALEAQRFIRYMGDALKSGLRANDEKVQEVLENHIQFLRKHGHSIDAKALAAQTKFFLEDDFHRNMLEGQQVGLSYYLCVATDMYAASK